MKKITVCIADMDVGYRASLRKALESSGSVEVVADAGDGLAALEAVETLHPQVLLTDTLLPGLDGLGLLRRIRGKGTRTIVITSAVMDNRAAGAAGGGIRLSAQAGGQQIAVGAYHRSRRASR